MPNEKGKFSQLSILHWHFMFCHVSRVKIDTGDPKIGVEGCSLALPTKARIFCLDSLLEYSALRVFWSLGSST